MREAVVDMFDGLADFAAARRGSAAARLKRSHERNPLVKRAGQQRGLTVAGMTDDGDTLRINGSVREQIVNGSLQPPRPRSDRAPIVIGKLRPNSFRGVWPVRLDIAVVKRRKGVAAIDGLVNRPNVDLFASTRFGGVVVRAAWRSAGHPTCRRRDQGIIDYHVIA